MKKALKNFLKWLTVKRYVEINFGTVESDEDLAQDFQRAKENLQIVNFQKIMFRLIQFERDFELASSGLLLTDGQAIERALAKFQQAKKDGRINELNEIVKEEMIYE